MRVEELRNAMKKLPFVPFRVATADGMQIKVASPEFALLSPDGRTIHVYEMTGKNKYRFHWLDVILLTRFEFDEQVLEEVQ
jgi:hypothetical protein